MTCFWTKTGFFLCYFCEWKLPISLKNRQKTEEDGRFRGDPLNVSTVIVLCSTVLSPAADANGPTQEDQERSGARWNKTANSNWRITPLHCACIHDDPKIFHEVMSRHGSASAAVDERDQHGKNLVHYAAANQATDAMLKTFVEARCEQVPITPGEQMPKNDRVFLRLTQTASHFKILGRNFSKDIMFLREIYATLFQVPWKSAAPGVFNSL